MDGEVEAISASHFHVIAPSLPLSICRSRITMIGSIKSLYLRAPHGNVRKSMLYLLQGAMDCFGFRQVRWNCIADIGIKSDGTTLLISEPIPMELHADIGVNSDGTTLLISESI